jgi:hypothetical protein
MAASVWMTRSARSNLGYRDWFEAEAETERNMGRRDEEKIQRGNQGVK